MPSTYLSRDRLSSKNGSKEGKKSYNRSAYLINYNIMATYADSGVDIEAGDRSSRAAYEAAKATFAGREGMFGKPVVSDDSFAGVLDFGDFYMVQNDDGVGTKSEVAERMNKFDTLGYDLLAMVCDDAICIGAEVVSVSNTMDVPSVNAETVEHMMDGLKKACLEQKVVIPGGEIAEVGNQVNGIVWNATAVGVVEKDKFMEGKEVAVGDKVIALHSAGIRSNGLSLVRHIMKEKFGEDWVNEKFDDTRTWGEVIITPSRIFHNAVLEIIGRYKAERKVNVHGIVHVTGGGVGNNLNRILKATGFGADLDALPTPHDFMLKLQEIGNVEDKEAYRTWNMGVGMLVIIAPEDVATVEGLLNEQNMPHSTIGTISEQPGARVTSAGFHSAGDVIEF